MASEPSHVAVRAKAHEGRGIGMLLLFKRNFAVQQVMKAGIWGSATTFGFVLCEVVTHHLICASCSTDCVTLRS